MPGFFSLEGAKQALGVTQTIEQCLAAQTESDPGARDDLLWEKEAQTRWAKVDHLLYLPLLGLSRPRELYYYQGPGLEALYGFTYKYLTVEHFLGRLTRLEVGQPLAEALARCYSQGWYPGGEPLVIYADWHVKPHWTKFPSHSGAVTMWGRVMPGTKQLLVNSPDGHFLGGWNMAIDSHLSRVLVDWEAYLAELLGRPIACTVTDSEGGGLPLAQRYLAAGQSSLSCLARRDYELADFEVWGPWEAVTGDPEREVALVGWQDPLKAATEVRDLVLMRRLDHDDPTRIYAGVLPTPLAQTAVPGVHRWRWVCQERVIREAIGGANLNVNYGYTYHTVPNRTIQRQWEQAQQQVEVSEQKLTTHQQAIDNLRSQLLSLRQRYQLSLKQVATDQTRFQGQFLARQAQGQPLRRCQQRLARLDRQQQTDRQRYRNRRHSLLTRLRERRQRYRQLVSELSDRQTLRDSLDTEAMCRERDLEKDQIMLNLQLLLTNLHHWVRDHFLAPDWQRLELHTATQLIYNKPGWVHWHPDRIEVVLEPYRYPEHQQAMVETCRRFNAAQLRWRDGRLLQIQVASP
jgi:hypothetical protein